MKMFKIIAGLAVLGVLGLAAYSYYSFVFFTNELNKKRTEPARQARWKDLRTGTEVETTIENKDETQG